MQEKELLMVKVCWLDSVKEVVLEMNEHVLQRGTEQGKEPYEV